MEVISHLDSGFFSSVFKCRSLVDNKIYAIKKNKKISKYVFLIFFKVIKFNFYLFLRQSELSKVETFISDLNNSKHILSDFILKTYEAWQEEGLLYIKQEYCCEGDLLDFLERLEASNFNFTEEFYWDIIFEMICVRIKP